jgi:hypothetical protein
MAPDVVVQDELTGLYNSELARTVPEEFSPPATSTSPLVKSVAVCSHRPVTKGRVADHVSELGSYNSAVLSGLPL